MTTGASFGDFHDFSTLRLRLILLYFSGGGGRGAQQTPKGHVNTSGNHFFKNHSMVEVNVNTQGNAYGSGWHRYSGDKNVLTAYITYSLGTIPSIMKAALE